jgi:hypothetical protein
MLVPTTLQTHHRGEDHVSASPDFGTFGRLTKAEIEIATNLINGKWHAAYGTYEHEMIGQFLGGLASEKVQALIAGLPTSFDDPREQVVYELTTALITLRVVPLGLYRRAKELLGDAGIVDVTILIGWYTGVSLTLAAYDVPANADMTALPNNPHTRPPSPRRMRTQPTQR